MKGKHIGSSFDYFLKEEGILDEATARALPRLIDEGLNVPLPVQMSRAPAALN